MTRRFPDHWAFAACLLVAGCSNAPEVEDSAATTTSPTVMSSRPATEPLAQVLLWLLSPTSSCSPPDPFLLLDSSEDPTVALLQALGFAPNTRSSCPSELADP
jgi:hypothetical protein